MLNKELSKLIQEKKVILFAGAGISKNLGLPNFSELIDQMSRELGYDPDIFKLKGNYQVLSEYYELEKGTLGQLRSWMDVEWHKDIETQIPKSDVHRLICDLNFPSIYTTNYDRGLELALDYYKKDFCVIKKIHDFREITDNKIQIIKFHGDLTDDSSIVLTESSYFERMNFENPLDIKLRSDMLEKSFLFLGYSLDDSNLRMILYRLNKLWQNNPFNKPNSYVFMGNSNEIQEKVLKSRGIETIVSEETDIKEGLIKFLKSLKQ